jgi:hypothetical protein
MLDALITKEKQIDQAFKNETGESRYFNIFVIVLVC